jgi:hypothetical protein
MTAASPDRGAFLRGSLLPAPLREPVASLCPGWPAGASAAPLHRCARQRLDLFSTAFAGESEAARALTISAGGCLHEHDCGPLEHPGTAESAGGTTAMSGRKLPSDRGSRRRCSRSGVEKPMLDIRVHDCSCPRLRPNPDRSGHLSSRDAIPRRSGATRWEQWRCQRRARLQGAPAGRAVERGISAKMPGAHRPEVPSVTRTFANERSHAREPKLTDSGAGAFFTTGQRARGTPAHARHWPGEIGCNG